MVLLSDDENGSSDMEKAKDEEARELNSKKRPAAGTLVVCPASVVTQWARELDEKVSDESKLSVLVYHGGNRTKDPSVLANMMWLSQLTPLLPMKFPNSSWWMRMRMMTKIHWLQLGDCNNKAFHNAVKISEARNTIREIKCQSG
ncbi:hypothetical protein DY000_02009856 [Brassica cretica]|uniref:SNF2 N-terminal domain-containing protein n=1 Tax=Brassica cretica TaxID=69181 RepID=A0ABQ7BRU3_BRACR|nr:hypothetical protein DY000_02009856 [Brassica cretica]